MVFRLFHRSTKTPAIGPTNRTGNVAAASTPLIASGAQDLAGAIRTAIQSVNVVSKMMSPKLETVWPHSRRTKSRLASSPGLSRDSTECPVTILSHASSLSTYVGRQRAQNSLQLEYCQARMFTQNLCHDSRHVRSSKTVARRRDPSAVQPRNSYINSERAEFS